MTGQRLVASAHVTGTLTGNPGWGPVIHGQ
jgi:hypothetical protein